MYPNPGLNPVSVSRGDVREEEDVAAFFDCFIREEEEADRTLSCLALAVVGGLIGDGADLAWVDAKVSKFAQGKGFQLIQRTPVGLVAGKAVRQTRKEAALTVCCDAESRVSDAHYLVSR